MTRRAPLAIVAAAAVVFNLAVLSAAGAVASVAAKPKPPPTHLLVYAQEWSLWPSRAKLPAGTVHVELWNRGQDMHDLRIRHLNTRGQMVGTIDGSVKVTPAGAISHATWHLKPGRYMIYCSMPGHFAQGMHARIAVSRPRR
jgi:uncharacterized cupredoxin-like copper-binding protein